MTIITFANTQNESIIPLQLLHHKLVSDFQDITEIVNFSSVKNLIFISSKEHQCNMISWDWLESSSLTDNTKFCSYGIVVLIPNFCICFVQIWFQKHSDQYRIYLCFADSIKWSKFSISHSASFHQSELICKCDIWSQAWIGICNISIVYIQSFIWLSTEHIHCKVGEDLCCFLSAEVSMRIITIYTIKFCHLIAPEETQSFIKFLGCLDSFWSLNSLMRSPKVAFSVFYRWVEYLFFTILLDFFFSTSSIIITWWEISIWTMIFSHSSSTTIASSWSWWFDSDRKGDRCFISCVIAYRNNHWIVSCRCGCCSCNC